MRRGISLEHARESREQIVDSKITAKDIDREIPEVDSTKIIIQRHERYIRTEEDVGEGEILGGLSKESTQKAYDQTKEIVEEMLSGIDDPENVEFLVVGSNTTHRGGGQRSIETAEQVLKAIREVAEEKGLDADQIINNRSRSKEVAKIARTQAPRFDSSPEYFDFLAEKYGAVTQKFWQAFEEDTHKEERLGFGAEGPDEMDERFSDYLHTLSLFSERYHGKNPKKRLIIWSASHYDTVSPYVKRHVTKTDPDQYLAVDYGAGVSIDVDKNNNATSNFRGKEYKVEL